MTEQQLLYFTKIVECGSYSDAALELNISQSSISKQILQFESELNVKLFDRTARRISLTEAGQRLYPEAVSALNRIDRIHKEAKKLQPGYKKTFTILTLPVIGQFKFYVAIRQFEMQHPDLSVRLVEVEEPEMFRRIKAHDYDAAISFYDSTRITSQMSFTPIIEDPLVVILHKDHPMSTQPYLTPEELEQMTPLLAMEPYTCINHLYEQYFWQHQINPEISFRGRPESIISAVQAQRGSALTSRTHVGFYQVTDVNLIPLEPACSAIFGVIVDTDRISDLLYGEFIQILASMQRDLYGE